MKLTAPLSALALAAALASPAAAFDLTKMSDAEREAFRGEVRNYLMENPEVLMEAIARSGRAPAANRSCRPIWKCCDTNHDEIVNDPASWVGGNPDGDITVVEFWITAAAIAARPMTMWKSW